MASDAHNLTTAGIRLVRDEQLDARTIASLKKYAEREDRPLSWVIRKALRELAERVK